MNEKIEQYLRGSVSRRRFLSGLGAMGVASAAATQTAYTLQSGSVDHGDGTLPPNVLALMQDLAAAFAKHGNVGNNYRVIRAVISSENEVDANGKVKRVKMTMGSANTCCVWRWSNGTLECEENC